MAKRRKSDPTTDRMRDIALGIGRGLQSYDPNNPLAGMGAAFSTTVASAAAREERESDIALREEERQEERRWRLEDIESAEKSQIEKERRDAEEAKARVDYAFKLKKQERADIQSEAEDAAERERKRMKEIYGGQRVHTIDGKTREAINPKMKFDLREAMGGAGLSVGANPPSTWSDYDLIGAAMESIDRGVAGRAERKPRKRVKATDPQTGKTFYAIEDDDQATPLYGPGGRNYAE